MSDDFVTIDTLLGVLRSRYRRQTLTFFNEAERDSAHIDELVEHFTVKNSETRDPDRLAAILHHTALPVLDDAGFIDYDAETHTVRFEGDSRLETALTLVDSMQE